MKNFIFLVGCAACLLVAPTPGRSQGREAVDQPGPLAARLLSGRAAGEHLIELPSLHAFYGARAHEPAWCADGQPSPRVDDLLAALRGADREGLRPAEYHLAAIEAILGQFRSASVASPQRRDQTDLDLLLTDAFFLYASHLTAGRVRPESVETAWNLAGRGRNLVFLLDAALARGHLPETLAALAPARADYRLLRDALAALRAAEAAGGWPLVPPGKSLRAGDRGPRVAALRLRLGATGELAADAEAGQDLLDLALEASLRRFQERHGLEPDGVAGRSTLAQLNTPARVRVRQIEANLERLRWLPRDLGPRHLLVNVADFRLALVEPDAPALEMRVIAGRLARQTPFFSSEITGILFNPSWTVPERLAVEDKLPQILADPGFLEDNGFTVLAPAGEGWREVDPAAIDWARLSAGNFPYRLRQEPGPGNALGRIKFQMPNRYDVYLHDTPARGLFARAARAFSSGCIRVERAADLAARLLAADPAWTRTRVDETSAGGSTVSVRLTEPLPVYLLYWTAWVDREGVLQLREDAYGRDAALLEALATPPRAPRE